MNTVADPHNLDLLLTDTLDLIGRQALEPMKLLAIAEKFGAAGRHKDAIGLYQHWLKSCASQVNYVILFNMAVAMSHSGDLPGAEKAYRDAIFQKPDFVQGWFNLGSVIEQQ